MPSLNEDAITSGDDLLLFCADQVELLVDFSEGHEAAQQDT